MKAEKVILSFVAIFFGLLAAGITFYLYQSTKVVPSEEATVTDTSVPTPVPTQADTNTFTLDEPKDEAVFDKKVVTVKGKTEKGTTIIVSSRNTDKIVQPADNGDFSLTQTIPDDTSVLDVTAIFPDGTEKTISRTVTFSTESF